MIYVGSYNVCAELRLELGLCNVIRVADLDSGKTAWLEDRVAHWL